MQCLMNFKTKIPYGVLGRQGLYDAKPDMQQYVNIGWGSDFDSNPLLSQRANDNHKTGA